MTHWAVTAFPRGASSTGVSPSEGRRGYNIRGKSEEYDGVECDPGPSSAWSSVHDPYAPPEMERPNTDLRVGARVGDEAGVQGPVASYYSNVDGGKSGWYIPGGQMDWYGKTFWTSNHRADYLCSEGDGGGRCDGGEVCKGEDRPDISTAEENPRAKNLG